jgi:uncharacterized protein
VTPRPAASSAADDRHRRHFAALLLMDEGKGRREAARRNLRTTTGTLGVLNDAASRGWVDLSSAFERLRQTTFRASPALLQSFLDRDAKRRQQS